MCHPFPGNVKGKRRNEETHKVHSAKRKDVKEQPGLNRASICKCGALGCGCVPLPDEKAGSKREDAPATSPHPVDLAIGWPFGYGPSFGWGPGVG